MSNKSDLFVSRTEKRLRELEGRFSHLHVRSELTMFIISSIIAAGAVQREGVKELIQDADLSHFGVNAISEKEREIMLTLIDKVRIA